MCISVLQAVGWGGLEARRAGADTPVSTADHFSDTSGKAGAGTRKVGKRERAAGRHAPAAAAWIWQTGCTGAIWGMKTSDTWVCLDCHPVAELCNATTFCHYPSFCLPQQEVMKKLADAANNTKSWKDKLAQHEGLIRLIQPGDLVLLSNIFGSQQDGTVKQSFILILIWFGVIVRFVLRL